MLGERNEFYGNYGAEWVGGTLAENLISENNNITIVDTNPDQLRQLQDKFDLRAIQGMGPILRSCAMLGMRIPTDSLYAVQNAELHRMHPLPRLHPREAGRLFLTEAVPINHCNFPLAAGHR
ncbi:NAD-binding protein [Sodalis-like endosymbiont of Proechinophthirus fluctus]|uniref:NAD-binding protein n=1 Tax=Sodalis-like endosymbiont of Proechinophthirus fluctus TaxID=1462730 RepID=UPI003F74E1D4